jgi:hypothetical protein
LKPQQRDLRPVLRRPVEPADPKPALHNNGPTKIGFAGACVGVGPSIKGDLDLEKIPESGELNNMFRGQNRTN